MDDVLKDAETISQVAYFVKHKDKIIAALSNKAKQTGKKEIIA